MQVIPGFGNRRSRECSIPPPAADYPTALATDPIRGPNGRAVSATLHGRPQMEKVSGIGLQPAAGLSPLSYPFSVRVSLGRAPSVRLRSHAHSELIGPKHINADKCFTCVLLLLYKWHWARPCPT